MTAPTMSSVLFVCLGNICRSPLAEAALRAEAERAGLDIITDGEMRRESYSNRFATALEGVDTQTTLHIMWTLPFDNGLPIYNSELYCEPREACGFGQPPGSCAAALRTRSKAAAADGAISLAAALLCAHPPPLVR